MFCTILWLASYPQTTFSAHYWLSRPSPLTAAANKKKKRKKDWFYVFAIQKLVNSSNQTRRMKWSACCWKRPPLLHFQAEPAVFTGNVKPVYEEILQMLPRSRCDSCLRSQMRANQWNLCVWEKGRVVRPRVTITRSAHITHVASLWAMGCFVGLGFWGSI